MLEKIWGTSNYMWMANIDYRVIPEGEVSDEKGNHAVLVLPMFLE